MSIRRLALTIFLLLAAIAVVVAVDPGSALDDNAVASRSVDDRTNDEGDDERGDRPPRGTPCGGVTCPPGVPCCCATISECAGGSPPGPFICPDVECPGRGGPQPH